MSLWKLSRDVIASLPTINRWSHKSAAGSWPVGFLCLWCNGCRCFWPFLQANQKVLMTDGWWLMGDGHSPSIPHFTMLSVVGHWFRILVPMQLGSRRTMRMCARTRTRKLFLGSPVFPSKSNLDTLVCIPRCVQSIGIKKRNRAKAEMPNI